MARSFNDALNVRADEIEKPPLPPLGSYIFQIMKVPEMTTSEDEKWDFVNFQLQAVSAMEDVDQDALSAFGDIRNVRQRFNFIFNREDDTAFDRTLYRLKKFLLEHVAISVDESASMKEMLSACVHHQFVGTIQYRPNKQNPEEMFSEIGKTAPIG